MLRSFCGKSLLYQLLVVAHGNQGMVSLPGLRGDVLGQLIALFRIEIHPLEVAYDHGNGCIFADALLLRPTEHGSHLLCLHQRKNEHTGKAYNPHICREGHGDVLQPQLALAGMGIGEKMSGFRLEHTLGVERMAVRLGELMAPEHVDLLRAAALLHDVTKELTLPVEKIIEANRTAADTLSLDTPVGDEEDTSIGSFVEDERTPGPADATSNALLAEALKEILDTLTEREADVLRMRFGMYDGRTHTLEEVGQIFGVTRERIRQIENKAIRKLRHPSRAKKIKDFYC